MALRKLVYECATPVPAVVRSICRRQTSARTLEKLFKLPGFTSSLQRVSRTTATWLDTYETLDVESIAAVKPFEIESYVLNYAVSKDDSWS